MILKYLRLKYYSFPFFVSYPFYSFFFFFFLQIFKKCLQRLQTRIWIHRLWPWWNLFCLWSALPRPAKGWRFCVCRFIGFCFANVWRGAFTWWCSKPVDYIKSWGLTWKARQRLVSCPQYVSWEKNTDKKNWTTNSLASQIVVALPLYWLVLWPLTTACGTTRCLLSTATFSLRCVSWLATACTTWPFCVILARPT